MIHTKNLAFAALFLVAACETPAINGSSDSGVRNLSVGMSPAEVGRIIGAHQFQNPVEGKPSQFCRSYEYDEFVRAKYVHAVFENDQLIRATDRHGRPC